MDLLQMQTIGTTFSPAYIIHKPAYLLRWRVVGGDGSGEVVEEDGEGGVEDPEAGQSGVDLQTDLSEGEKVPRFEEPAGSELLK